MRARSIAAISLLATFVAGALAGYAVARATNRNPLLAPGVVASAMVNVSPTIPTNLEKLHLSDDQRQRILEVLRAQARNAARTLGSVAPALSSISDSAEAQVRAILTPEQRTALGPSMGSRTLRVTRDSSGARHVDTLGGGGRR